MITRKIKTRLVGREEVFKMFALAETLRLPILLEGPPGTAKSHSMMDYAEGNRDNVFIVELDAGSKASEVKGFIDMKALLENKQYQTISPIVDKEFILINEVEKGSSEIRNTMLSLMQERMLQLGSEGVKPAKWRLFAGSCNSIPADEKKEPFWDRFLLKHVVSRLSHEEMMEAQKREYRTLEVNVYDENELPQISLAMIKKFDQLTENYLSDRARLAAPRIAAGVKIIWNIDDYQAICKTAAFLCPSQVAHISTNLIPKQVVEIKSMMQNVRNAADYDARAQIFAKLVTAFKNYSRLQDRDVELLKSLKPEMQELSEMMEKELEKHQQQQKQAAKKEVAEATSSI